MPVTFSPRDRRFVNGAAVRRFGTPTLSGLDVEVAAGPTLELESLRHAFGAFERIEDEHPGGRASFSATYRPPKRSEGCSIVVTLRPRANATADPEAVRQISIARQ